MTENRESVPVGLTDMRDIEKYLESNERLMMSQVYNETINNYLRLYDEYYNTNRCPQHGYSETLNDRLIIVVNNLIDCFDSLKFQTVVNEFKKRVGELVEKITSFSKYLDHITELENNSSCSL